MTFSVDVRTELPDSTNQFTSSSVVNLSTQDGSRLSFSLSASEAEQLAARLLDAARRSREEEAGWCSIKSDLSALPREAVVAMRVMDTTSRVALADAIARSAEFTVEEVDPMDLAPWQAALSDNPEVTLGFFAHSDDAVAAGTKMGLRFLPT